MTDTPNLALPYIFAAQAQKHVTHNEAIRALDCLVQLSVADRHLAAPPGSPVEGERYLVAAAASGAWVGQSGRIAAFQDGAWAFYVPRDGWIVWVADENVALVYDGGAWSTLVGGPIAATTLGINGATADTTNRLAVTSPATLFNHAGNGHQVKVNKNAAGDTASFLYQTGFSGRAEIGLTGDDDFHFKVSSNGSAWFEGIRIDRANGRVSFPSGGAREILAANRTYYVRSDGSDSNTGLVNDAGGAFLTIQKALDVVATLDTATFSVTVQVANGTWTEALILKQPIGVGALTLRGDTTTPTNVVLSRTSGTVLTNVGSVQWTVAGFQVTTTGSTNGVRARYGGTLITLGNMDFAACGGAHIMATEGGTIVNQSTNYTISGAAVRHWWAESQGMIIVSGRTITISGTPAFSGHFATGTLGGILSVFSNTFSGSATGQRYSATNNSVIFTNGGGATYLPGDTSGSATSGGQYS